MDDSELIIKLKDENSRNFGFNLLINKYQEKIYFHVRRMVIDHDESNDLVQETFIRVFKNIDKFREDSSLYTWIYRIATNLCLNHLNQKKRRFFLPIADISDQLVSAMESSAHVTGDEIQLKLQKAILQLPDKQRIVFNLKYYEEMKYNEMAEVTGTSVGALKASYHHAVKKIENYLKSN